MTKIQNEAIEQFVYGRVAVVEENMEHNMLYALCQALDCNDYSLEDAIIDFLRNGSYMEPSDSVFTPESINTLLKFADERKLSLENGIDSIIETFVTDQIGVILEMDLIEMI